MPCPKVSRRPKGTVSSSRRTAWDERSSVTLRSSNLHLDVLWCTMVVLPAGHSLQSQKSQAGRLAGRTGNKQQTEATVIVLSWVSLHLVATRVPMAGCQSTFSCELLHATKSMAPRLRSQRPPKSNTCSAYLLPTHVLVAPFPA